MGPDTVPERATAYCADSISAGYGEVDIVRCFSLWCNPGEVVGIIGPNGSGKSTLMRRLAGLLPHKGGQVHIGYEDITGLGPGQLSRRGVKYVPQTRDVFPSLNVRDNLVLGQARDELRSRMDRVIGMLPSLGMRLTTYAADLSGGERKLLGVGRALMSQGVAVLLVDEPSAGLSPQAASVIWPALQKVASDGARIVLVEQQVDPVIRLASRVYVMVGGEGRAELSGQDLIRADLGELFLS